MNINFLAAARAEKFSGTLLLNKPGSRPSDIRRLRRNFICRCRHFLCWFGFLLKKLKSTTPVTGDRGRNETRVTIPILGHGLLRLT